ncbi:SLAC1 anion channel family protein [Dactylosporangium sp. NBC_01737]|uniref:SLAC1 anion channel family protein n=1 Tax=Dactylosporangium sp. NBC_01737 TaxID=2975959 RepID=UPI002E124561|nr:SLAC1 anion channel family protein [Dactylosporangium sp. NBC_01737]
MAGTAVAWQRAAEVTGRLYVAGTFLSWSAAVLYGVIGLAYLAKAVRHPAAARAEWRDPVRVAFLPLASVGLMLTALAVVADAPRLSAVLWWSGAVAHLGLTLWILDTWTRGERFRPAHVHPAWFIPAVGNLVAPLAGTHHAPHDMLWFLFAVGIVYWLGLLPIILGRLLFAGPLPAPLPAPLQPTLAIMIAPPAVGYLSYVALGGEIGDPFARVLLAVAVFQTLLLAVRAPHLRRVLFSLS